MDVYDFPSPFFYKSRRHDAHVSGKADQLCPRIRQRRVNGRIMRLTAFESRMGNDPSGDAPAFGE